MENEMNLDQMIDKIRMSSPPSVMVKARMIGDDYECFININSIDDRWIVSQPEEYTIYYSPENTKIIPYQ